MCGDLKLMIENTCDLFDLIDEKVKIMEKADAQGKLSNILRFELMSFLMCLSAVDGRISRVEAKLIRDYLGVEVYPIHIKQTIDENGIGTKEYYHKTPESLRLAVKIDNYMIKHGSNVDKGVSEIVLELFKVMGKEMVVADNKVTLEEQLAWGKYMSMMAQYIVDKSLIYQQSGCEKVIRPGTPIEVDYEMSLDKVGRIYTLYYGKFDKM